MQELKNSSLTIPIFPLPIVAFPTSYVPLHIFEERYKMMMKDILETDRKFGIVMTDGRVLAQVGCLVQLVNHEPLADGRMNILTQGKCRFAVEELCGHKPYKQAIVKVLAEQSVPASAYALADNVREAVSDVYRLLAKLDDREFEPPEDIPTDPLELSFWVPSRLYGDLIEQQRILELDDVESRLQPEFSLLDSARKHMAAKTALKDALN